MDYSCKMSLDLLIELTELGRFYYQEELLWFQGPHMKDKNVQLGYA